MKAAKSKRSSTVNIACRYLHPVITYANAANIMYPTDQNISQATVTKTLHEGPTSSMAIKKKGLWF